MIAGLQKPLKAQSATKFIFLVCGLGISSWAPMVPYAKERLGLNDANLGLLLLLLGGGAIAMMPVSGILSHRYGSRVVILGAALLMAFVLPLLMLTNTPVQMGIALFIFGAAVGTVDVAMNTQGVQVENIAEKPIMSSLHGLFSVGGLLGSLGLGFLMRLGLAPEAAAITIAILLIIIVSLNYKSLLDMQTEKAAIQKFSSHVATDKKTSWFTGSVLFLGLMCFAVFLSEGAMLDWSALFLKESRGITEEFSGIGYAAFSIAMAFMRLTGDKLVSKFDGKTVVVAGSLVAGLGILLAVATPWLGTTILGFVLLGLGAANIVPVFISEGGKLKDVPATVAIPVISTIGYAGQLAGPAILGFIAYSFSLPIAFGFTAMLLFMVSISYSFRKPK
ncbi:MFS transporter [Pedobacter sp. PLR]|uniref:MFS transporter n=1 Tax=Pedobacter sp. PLR TaxID=2994465 RepID=UPI0022455432|nr:MFS transporter [Pedobacter sp. PLR]MCX2452610.1 MFS transporter [Pedobacter sp. PLR]